MKLSPEAMTEVLEIQARMNTKIYEIMRSFQDRLDALEAKQ